MYLKSLFHPPLSEQRFLKMCVFFCGHVFKDASLNRSPHASSHLPERDHWLLNALLFGSPDFMEEFCLMPCDASAKQTTERWQCFWFEFFGIFFSSLLLILQLCSFFQTLQKKKKKSSKLKMLECRIFTFWKVLGLYIFETVIEIVTIDNTTT